MTLEKIQSTPAPETFMPHDIMEIEQVPDHPSCQLCYPKDRGGN